MTSGRRFLWQPDFPRAAINVARPDHAIEVPFPQRVVHLRGGAPPA